jgi:1,4-alpha-glucan branching enzyme
MLKKRYIKSRQVWKVTFEVPAEQLPEGQRPEQVNLVGEFNNWDTKATPMKRGKGRAYRAMIELEPGREYQFRYLVDGERWCNDWQADAYVPNQLGADNCVAVLAAAG